MAWEWRCLTRVVLDPTIATPRAHVDPSLIDVPGVLHPAGPAPARRIVVRPVDEAALIVPHVLALELDLITDAEVLHARRDIDVVHDQYRLARREQHEKPLMPVPLVVIGKHT